MRFKLLFLISILAVSLVQARPYLGDVFDYTQPDGSKIQYKLFGDEYYADFESIDGYTLILGKDNFLYYAEINRDGQSFVSTGIKYSGNPTSELKIRSLSKGLRLPESVIVNKAELKRIQMGNPSREEYLTNLQKEYEAIKHGEGSKSTDTLFGLTVLIDFPDQKTDIPRDELEKFLNMIGYNGFSNPGSVYDFYYAMSNGNLKYKQIITPFITASNNKTYFEAGGGGTVSGLIQDVMSKLVLTGFDASKVTKSGTKFKAINFLYAGTCSSAWSTGLWPHMSSCSFGVTLNGATGGGYELTDIKKKPALGTICHENGHLACGYPDLYPYSGSETTVGAYDLMCYGIFSAVPVFTNSYFRTMKGWYAATDITNAPAGSVFTLKANGPQCLQYKNKADAKESFFIEARLKTVWSQGLPDQGGIVWWINTAGQNTTPGGTKLVMMKYADNANSDAGNCFKQSKTKRLNATSTPNANFATGASGMDLYFLDDPIENFRIGITDQTSITNTVLPNKKFSFSYTNNSLAYTLPATINGLVNLYNLEGQIVKNLGNGLFTAATRYSMPVNGLGAGQYILRIRSAGFNNDTRVTIVK